MKTYRKELHFNLPTRRGLVNITNQVQKTIDDSGIKEGLALINPMHITASVFINDDEAGLHHVFKFCLKAQDSYHQSHRYQHNGFEDNADAHIKRTIMGRESVVAITAGKLDFGTWERIFYYEFDGKRDKRVLIKIVGEQKQLIRMGEKIKECFFRMKRIKRRKGIDNANQCLEERDF